MQHFKPLTFLFSLLPEPILLVLLVQESTCVGGLAAAVLSVLLLDTQNVTFQIARLFSCQSKFCLTRWSLYTDAGEDCECCCTEIESIQTSYWFSSRNLEMMSTTGNTRTRRTKWTVTLTSMRGTSPTVTKRRMHLGGKAGS